MDWIDDQFSQAPAPTTLVHLGAGACCELTRYIQSGAGRIVLVEPNQEVMPELEKRAQAHSHVQILPVAVAAQAGRRALKVFNYSNLSSLRQPTGLFQILPGLQQTGEAIVDVIAAHTLPERLSLKNDGGNWIVIDTPGEEAAIISALQQHNLLTLFDRIILRAGSEIFYDGASTAEELTAHLEQVGYDVENANDISDQGWPRFHLRLNPKAIECRRLRKEKQSLTEQLEEQKSETEKHARELDEARRQTEQQREDLTSQNEKLKAKLEELEETRQQAEQENESLTSQNEELQAKLEEIEEAQRQAEQQKNDLKIRNADLEAKFKEREKCQRQTQQQMEEMQTEIRSLKSELAAARNEYQQQRADVSVALRLQNLRENDLKDLQQRYGQLRQANQAQKELLGKLYQRLSVAADYLRLINEQHGEGDELQEGLVRALTGSDSEDA